MSEDAEPDRNIGTDTSAVAPFEDDDPATRAEAVVDRLGELYWQKTYGGQDAFECLVRTILSQNTSDTASQPAHDALVERYGSDGTDLVAALADAGHATLAETIRSAGLYNQKAETIIRLAGRIRDEYGNDDGFDEFVTECDPETVRETLLDMKGVGPKTADCVLLFASGRAGVFPVDTHVHRIYRRLGIAPADADHETVRAVLERDVSADKCGFQGESNRQMIDEGDGGFSNGGTYVIDGEEIHFRDGGVPPEKCGFGHTATIQFGREYCTARKPACLEGPEACPLYDLCDRIGVYPETGDIVDPAETVD